MRTAVFSRVAWWDGAWATVVLPAVVAVVTVAGTFAAALGQPEARGLDALGVVLLLVGPAALVLRRANPPVAIAVAAAAAGCYLAADYPYGPVFLSAVVAMGSAVRQGHRRGAYLVTAATVVVLLVVHLVRTGATGSATTWTALFGWSCLLAAIIALCEWWRLRSERAAQDASTRRETQRRQVVEERLAIARELHDALGHHVSLINVQAGVALQLFDGDPEQARSALATIKASSRELLGEMRSTLGVLRGVDEDPSRAPVADLDRLPALVEENRAAGLEVDLDTLDPDRPVPASVGHAVFRIVQESLTNTRKHAGAEHARVRVAAQGGELTVEVHDDGRGGGAPRRSADGNGLVGMRERAVALGGSLEAGPGPGGGFAVRATLPLESTRIVRESP